MANKNKVETLQKHLDKTLLAISAAIKGNAPKKHQGEEHGYLTFLKKDVMLAEIELKRLRKQDV